MGTPVERTRRVIAQTMCNIESYLDNTMETCEDFVYGWLPTLDTSLRVNNGNQVEFKFFEKETSCRTAALQSQSAMCKNMRMQKW